LTEEKSIQSKDGGVYFAGIGLSTKKKTLKKGDDAVKKKRIRRERGGRTHAVTYSKSF